MPFGQEPFAPEGRSYDLAEETGHRIASSGLDCIVACFDRKQATMNIEATRESVFYLARMLVENYPEAVAAAARRFAEEEEQDEQG
mgnify:CR=1 FL=1